MEDVITAIHTLHGPGGSKDEKQQADLWLRQWQQTPGAWEAADILLTSSTEYEIQHTAAITLRTKILYDFTQLPESAHEPLCQSLLRHIDRFKQYTPPTVLTTLALALADLSLYTCRSWPNFMDTIASKLSAPEDLLALLLCLKVLPEENSNELVLVEPMNISYHATILESKVSWVAEQLQQALSISQDNPAVLSKIIECFVEWITFVDGLRITSRSSSEVPVRMDVSETFLDVTFRLLSSNDPSLCDTAIESLAECLSIAQREPEYHSVVLSMTLKELAAPDGRIRLALTRSLQEDDRETTFRLARVYRFGCIGNCKELTTMLHRDPLLKELLSILLRMSAIPFSLEDECCGSNGIATQILDFWDEFSLTVRRQRAQLGLLPNNTTGHYYNDNSKTSSSPSTSPDYNKTSNEIDEIITQQDALFTMLIRTLLEQCKMPLIMTSGEYTGDSYDFYNFRSYVCFILKRIGQAITRQKLFQLIFESLVTETQRIIKDQRTQEAHLLCLSKLLNNECSQDPIAVPLCKLAEDLEGLLLFSPPANVVECFTRTAATHFLGKLAANNILTEQPELVVKTLNMLGSQVFVESTTKDHDSLSSHDLLSSSRNALSLAASEAILQLCINCRFLSVMHNIAQQLFEALKTFQTVDEKSYCNVLEGVTVFVSSVDSDEQFLKYSEELLDPIVKSIIVSKIATENLAIQLDRLSLVLKFLTPHSTQIFRREALGSFLTEKLWPLIEHLLKSRAESSVLVERCGRALKHSMRCVRGDIFKKLVGPLATILITNSKMILHPTYLYVAEWLVAEYSEDLDICPNLEILFNELSYLGLDAVQKGVKEGQQVSEEDNLIEDCFGMFCRYFRHCPTIPANARTLPTALEVAYRFLHHCNPVVVGMICTFFQFLANASATLEPEEGALNIDPEVIKVAKLRLESLFNQHLPRICTEFFRVLLTIPPTSVIDHIATALNEVRRTCNLDVLKNVLQDSITCFPPAVLASQNYKESIVMDLVHGEVSQTLHELYFRCRQVGLRQRAAASL